MEDDYNKIDGEAGAPRRHGPHDDQTPRSPRLLRLRQEIDAGRPDAVNAFWKELERHGAPIVEDHGGAGERLLVTFIMRSARPESLADVVFDNTCRGLMSGPPLRISGSDVWYRSIVLAPRSRILYRLSRAATGQQVASAQSPLSPQPPAFCLDPFNPHSFRLPKLHEDGVAWEWSVVELPGAPRAFLPGEETVSDVTHLQCHAFYSNLLGNERRLWLMGGRGEAASDDVDLLLFLDGAVYAEGLKVPRLLTHLSRGGVIPRCTAAFVDIINFSSRAPEYLCNPTFGKALAEEVPSFISEVTARKERFRRIFLIGSSYGGVAAAHATLSHASVFSGALCQSASFWWNTSREDEGFALQREFPKAPAAAPYFVLTVGQYERDALQPQGISVREGVRRFANHLRRVGSEVEMLEYPGAHDFLSWRANLPNGLRLLLLEPSTSAGPGG